MARQHGMTSYWATEDGWPYADSGPEEADPSMDVDDDLLSMRATPAHLFDGLNPIERDVVTARYGLDGRPARTLKELGREMGLPRGEVRGLLGSGLSKVRHNLSG